MVPAWHCVDRKWFPCWLLSTAPHGGGQGHVLIAFDDEPHPTWGYPAGSLRIGSVGMSEVRIRRTMIPLMGKVDDEPYDRDGYGSGSEGC